MEYKMFNKHKEELAKDIQGYIMTLVKFLREDLGYDFKLTHNGIASEIRKSETFEAPSDDGYEQEAREEYEREKNLDYAMDNMTNDLVYDEETGQWTSED